MINNYLKVLAIVSFCSLAFSASEKTDEQDSNYYPSYFGLDRDGQVRGGIGQFGFPSNPMNDRAKGYLLNGVIKNAVSNYGNFITWDEHPAGLWGEYSYLPHVGMIAGVPGHQYSSHYQDWVESDMSTHYSDWYAQNGDELVVLVEGPKTETTLYKKAYTSGIWINKESVKFIDLPSFYLINVSNEKVKSEYKNVFIIDLYK